MTSHLRLDFNRVEYLSNHLSTKPESPPQQQRTHLAVVDTDDATNHLGDDDHVTEMSLDDGRLLIWWGLLLGFAEFLDEAHGLAL